METGYVKEVWNIKMGQRFVIKVVVEAQGQGKFLFFSF